MELMDFAKEKGDVGSRVGVIYKRDYIALSTC